MKNSHYKKPEDLVWLNDWITRCKNEFSLPFTSTFVSTSKGKTHVYCYNMDKTELPAIVAVPGLRTTTAYWALNKNLEPFRDKYRIYLIETIGQPGLSDGTNLNILNDSYGHWLTEVANGLQLNEAFWMGASFGCQLIVKLSQVSPHLIKKIAFICPGGIVQVSFRWKSMGTNLWFASFPNEKSKASFLRNIVYGPKMPIDEKSKALATEGIVETVKRFRMYTAVPYPAPKKEFRNMTMPVLIMSGEMDYMFSPRRLQKRIPKVFTVQPKFEVLEGHCHAAELGNLPFQKAAQFFEE